MDSARAFEENGVAFARITAKEFSRLGRVLEKKRGVGPKACTRGCVQRATGRAAYSNEHIYPPLRCVLTDTAVQRLGPNRAKFKHLPQNCDPPPRRNIGEDIQHGANCVWIGVVAIVIHQNTPVMEAAPPHFSGL